MTLRSAVLLAVSCLFLAACSPEEPVINSFEDRWRILSAEDAGLGTYTMPGGNRVAGQAWRNDASTPLNVTRFRTFRDELFILRADTPEIVVLANDTLRERARIDCRAWGAAQDIAFANATTAYATHPSSNVVSIIDLTTYSIVRTIRVDSLPNGIAAAGNQIGVACSGSGTVAIIDSRSNAVETTVTVGHSPFFIESDATGEQFVVVSLGDGHLNDNTRTVPTLSLVNLIRRTVTSTVDLTARASEGPQQNASGLVVTASDYAYVPVQNGLLQINTRGRSRAGTVQFEDYRSIYYNPNRAELLCVKQDRRTVDVYDEYAENRKTTMTATIDIQTLLGIAP